MRHVQTRAGVRAARGVRAMSGTPRARRARGQATADAGSTATIAGERRRFPPCPPPPHHRRRACSRSTPCSAVAAGHRRLPDRGAGPGAGRDRQPVLGAGPPGRARRHGVGADDLAGVAVTHIHLDHAGGVGDVARAFPEATVYVHEKGARHLADPTGWSIRPPGSTGRLLDSLYGRLDPTPAERIHVLADGEEIEIGPGPGPDHGRLARPRQAPPGPARLRQRDPLRRRRGRGPRCPTPGCCARPPRRPDFDLDQALTRWHVSRPAGRAASPWPTTACSSTRSPWSRPRRRCACGRRRPSGPAGTGRTSPTALSARFDPLLGDIDPAHKEKLETLNGVHSNAAGFRRWLDTRQGLILRPVEQAPPEGLCCRDVICRDSISGGVIGLTHQTTSLALSSSWRSSKSSREMRPSARSSCRAANSSSRRVWSTSPGRG